MPRAMREGYRTDAEVPLSVDKKSSSFIMTMCITGRCQTEEDIYYGDQIKFRIYLQ